MDQALMDALTDSTGEQGYLKAGTLGFAGCGKTMTAALMAVAVKRRFKLPGPIAQFDTEGGSVYIRPVIYSLCGYVPDKDPEKEKVRDKPFVAKRARSFQDMLTWGKACVQANISVGIVDSVTHPWRELCDSYLEQVNAFYRSKNWSERTKLEFQDWPILKGKWQVWTDFYLNSPLHLIICGRAGDVYEWQQNEKGKKELIKTGDLKMKTEGEFGYEPSLLVELERTERQRGDRGDMETCRVATVVKDRFSVIDSRSQVFWSVNADNPKELESAVKAVDTFFGPHLDRLTPGAHAEIDMQNKTSFTVQDGSEEWQAEKKSRTILCEEIQGELMDAYPGQTLEAKKAKADAINSIFGTRSWTKVEGMESGKLRAGLKALRDKLRPPKEPSPNGEKPAEPKTELAKQLADSIGLKRQEASKEIRRLVDGAKDELEMERACTFMIEQRDLLGEELYTVELNHYTAQCRKMGSKAGAKV